MSKLKVALRVRPLSVREREDGYPIVVQVENNSAFITDIRVPEKPAADSRQRFRQFDFDHAFWLTECGEWGATQEEVYEEMGPSLEKSILDGYNACLLAYGQSGTGKTHTMLGTKTDPGLIPRLCQSLWEKLRENRENSTFKMEVSFMEIYREKVRDLLTPDKPLKLREHPQNGPHVQDLTRVEVSEEIGLVDLLWEGERRRAIGTTGSNRRSSRSHAIWTLYLSYRKGADFQQLVTNQVHLVDLAGSEKADLAASKNLLAEGADINRSLVSLGNVISSLAEKLQYIPYRDSALTWLLKDSLGGNANTSIIINIVLKGQLAQLRKMGLISVLSISAASPASCSHAQTLNSLRFAQRARLVENKPEVNLSSCSNSKNDSYIASIFDIRKDISRLANILKVAQNNGGILRGLTPRNGWNRLISAIEGWNHVQEREASRMERAASTETNSTSTTRKSLTDVMVQKNSKVKADLNYEDAHSCSSSMSVPATPCHGSSESSSVASSGSIKCLTWKQSEVTSLPKAPTPPESEDEYASPPQTPKVHHLKYIVPVRFPTSHHIDSESRINERIHRQFDHPEPQEISPTEFSCPFENNKVLIRHKLPTLVSPQKLDVFDESSEHSPSYSTSNSPSGDAYSPVFLGATVSETMQDCYPEDLQVSHIQPQPVFKKASGKRRIHRPTPRITEFATLKPEELFLFESTDEGEFSDCLEIDLNQSKNFRAVDFGTEVEVGDVTPPFTSLEDSYASDNSDSSTKKTTSSSSSSSYESLVVQKPVGHVKVVENSTVHFRDDFVVDTSPDDFKALEKRVTSVAVSESLDEDEAREETVMGEIPESDVKKPLDGSNSTAFRNFYVRELNQLDSIGKQIKSLQNLAQKYEVLRPYLKKIEELQTQDFSKPDPEIDAHIEHCSGWNPDIEYQKVQNEVASISKILKNNQAAINKLPRRDSSSASNHSHRTSSTSITSDSCSATNPNSRRPSYASTAPDIKPKFPNVISTLTISSDLDSSISLSAPNSSILSVNLSQSVSQPDVSSLPYQPQPPPQLHFDYTRRVCREAPPLWSPHSSQQFRFESPCFYTAPQPLSLPYTYDQPNVWKAPSNSSISDAKGPQPFAAPPFAPGVPMPPNYPFCFAPQPPPNYVWSPAGTPSDSHTSPTKNGFKQDPFTFHPAQPPYYSGPKEMHHRQAGYGYHQNTPPGINSPFRSLSTEGGFSQLNGDMCKSCSMEFCSCEGTLAGKYDQNYMPFPSHTDLVDPDGIKQRSRGKHSRSSISSYDMQFSS